MQTKTQLIEQLEDELYGTTTGHVTAIEVVPGGQRNGLDYGPAVIEIVVLDHDGTTIAYRHSNDAIDEDWQLGTVEDAVEAALDYSDTYRQQVP